jgi:3-oxoacyl-[acyl-carrier-protein] synthase III
MREALQERESAAGGPADMASYPAVSELLDVLGALAGRGPDASDDAILDAALRAAYVAVPSFRHGDVAATIAGVLGPSIVEGTVQGFAYRKPRGYAGDFEIIDKMYRQETSADPALAAWDRYYHRHAAATAVRNRKALFLEELRALRARRGAEAHVLDLASGPCRDLHEFFGETQARDLFVDCVESDFDAIAFALRLNAAFAAQLRFVPGSVFRFQPSRRYDLVWSAGLFDYLDDAGFVRLLRRCLEWAAADGQVVVGNFSPCNPTRAYMELVTDWRLHHRSSDDLLDLACRAGALRDQCAVEAEEQGVNLFLRIRPGPAVPAVHVPVAGRRSVVVATGSCIPERVVANDFFAQRTFVDRHGQPLADRGDTVALRFSELTGIRERRYAPASQRASDLAALAAERALAAAALDRERLEGLIVAHNWGDVGEDGVPDALPNLAARVKHKLGIRNRRCVSYDVVSGCTGWLHALVQADAFVRLGQMRNVLVVGADTASRVVDPTDRDSLIFADGAGAVLVGAGEGEGGILSHASVSQCQDDLGFLEMVPGPGSRAYLRMRGPDVFRFALQEVPPLIRDCLHQAQVPLAQVSKFLVHQANERMLRAIVERTARLEGVELDVETVLPLSVGFLGNSSVATIPTLWDLLRGPRLGPHRLAPGSIVVLAAVGAGMHAACVVYRLPDEASAAGPTA